MGCLCSKKGKENTMDDEMKAIQDSKLPFIWVLGGPGSGKGTQCKKLAAEFGFKHLSTGELLRTEAATGSELGVIVAEAMRKGELVDRDVVLDLLKKAILLEIETAKGFLIDGYPLEVEQADAFESKIAPCAMILYMKCSDDTMMERLKGRGRSDDSDDSIMKRLETFHMITEPVLAKYTKKVVTVDANGDVETTSLMCQEKFNGLV